eukprot:jgi/Psemu1/325206/estExt_fgenesh1_pg.C_2140007
MRVLVRHGIGQSSRITPRLHCIGQPKNFPRWLSSSSEIAAGLSDDDDDDDDDKEHAFLHSLPWQFLRASDSAKFDEVTSQRKDVLYSNDDGKPVSRGRIALSEKRVSIQKVRIEQGNKYKILWDDGEWSNHEINNLKQQYLSWKRCRPEDRILWENLTEEYFRQSPDLSMSYESLIANDDAGMSRALKTLYQYGILLVTNTPIDDNGVGIAVLGAALGGGNAKDNPSVSLLANHRVGGTEVVLPDGTDGPMRTLYGGVWATSSGGQPGGTSVADSAYGHGALPLHTDFTYARDPPGLQIFTMVQPAIVGGESVVCDGFAVAETLRNLDPAAFDVLSNTSRTYHSKDEVTGWYLKATGPIIQERNGRIISIRHNDLDRLPDLPPNDLVRTEEIEAFYENLERAHASWDSLIAQDKFRLVMKLQPGDTIVVANQRCFHGRYKFESTTKSPRSVMGCYISQDELSSRFRMEGFDA